MKKYIILLKDKQKGSLKKEWLNGHIGHLKHLKQEGILELCGPFTDNDGAIQILKANTLAEVESYIQADPLIKEHYYQHYEIHELIEANELNNYLLEDTQTKLNQQG